jgi:L-fuculose-phosphate aldolase
MLLAPIRQGIVRACRELSAAGLVVGTAGNVSAREGDLVAVTPSGVDYADMSAEQVGVHRLDGTPVDAPLKPTSELPLHLAVYAATGAGAIVHTHSPAATAVSTLAEELPPIHYYVAMFGGTVRVAPYATYGTDELARSVADALDCRTACLMGNHGAVTTGADLKTAHDRAVYLEWLCDVYLRAASAGTPRLLPPDEIEAVARKLASYGQLCDAGVRVRVRAGAVGVAMAYALAYSRTLAGRGDGAVAVAGHALIQLSGAAGAGLSWLMRLIRAAPSARGDLVGRGSQAGVGCRASWHRIPAWPARITSRFSGRYWSTGTPASLVQNRAQCSASSAAVMNERH